MGEGTDNCVQVPPPPLEAGAAVVVVQILVVVVVVEVVVTVPPAVAPVLPAPDCAQLGAGEIGASMFCV